MTDPPKMKSKNKGYGFRILGLGVSRRVKVLGFEGLLSLMKNNKRCIPPKIGIYKILTSSLSLSLS